MANLVANALRHSPAGPRRRWSPASALGDRVELRVVDRGPGRRRSRSGTGSSRRSSGSATATTATGVGLGLALSRGLAEAMGGTLDAEDTPGGGLTMVLSLPGRTRRSPAPADRRADVPADGSAAR